MYYYIHACMHTDIDIDIDMIDFIVIDIWIWIYIYITSLSPQYFCMEVELYGPEGQSFCR